MTGILFPTGANSVSVINLNCVFRHQRVHADSEATDSVDNLSNFCVTVAKIDTRTGTW